MSGNKWFAPICCFVVLFLASSCSKTDSMTWESLSLSGKGVIIVKVKENERSNYYLVGGTNRVMPLHEVEKTGKRFTSFESLLEFVELKPADVMLIEATSEHLSETEGKLEVLSSLEEQKICLRKADSSSQAK